MKKVFVITALLFSVILFGQIPSIQPMVDLKKPSQQEIYNASNGINQVYKWEAYTGHGVIIFGVSETKAKAEWTIKDFTERNIKNAYKPIGHVIKKAKKPSSDYVSSFKKKYPKGYKVLMQREVIALRMIKLNGMNSASDFIESVTKKNHSEAFEYLFKLSNSIKKYSIKY